MNAPNDLHRFYQPLRPGRDVTVATLSLSAVYQAPSGRLCRLTRRFEKHRPGEEAGSFNFTYIDASGAATDYRMDSDGFRLTAANVSMLREVLR